MSAFHRIDDYNSMDSARFFNLAVRLPAYRGVCRARIEGREASKANRGGGTSQQEASVSYDDPSVAQYFQEG